MTNTTTPTEGCNAAIRTALMAYASDEAAARAKMAQHDNERQGYIAFGSNLSLRQMFKRMGTDDIKVIGRYRVQHWARRYGKYNCVATAVAHQDSTMPAVVYALTGSQLKKLDIREGPEYGRHWMEIDGIYAWTYMIKRGPFDKVPERKYLERILAGLQDHGFDPEAEELAAQLPKAA